MVREVGNWLPVPPRNRHRRFALLAPWIVLSLVAFWPFAAVFAEQPVADPAASREQFDIRLVPREQREAVPYELGRGTVVFKALINGREVWAFLDNRASGSLIDEALARSLGLQLNSVAGRVITPTGALERWRVSERVDISIPGQVGMQTPVSATDLSLLSAVAGRPISLIVGKEYFDVLVFVFTPRNRQFQLGPSGSLRLPADAPYLILQNDRPQIEVMVAGRPTLLTIDLGYNGDIALRQEAWDRLGISELPTTPNASVNMDGLITPSVATTLDEVSLGSRRVKDVKVALTTAFPDDRDGLIGFGMLSRFNFALDIKARRLWLIPPFSTE